VARPSVLQAFYSIHSERATCWQLNCSLVVRKIAEPTVHNLNRGRATFSNNCERLLGPGTTGTLLCRTAQRARREVLRASKHYGVDGTLIER